MTCVDVGMPLPMKLFITGFVVLLTGGVSAFAATWYSLTEKIAQCVAVFGGIVMIVSLLAGVWGL
jgi:hypothetical protein